jgi:DNA-binding response OmpR family regulator
MKKILVIDESPLFRTFLKGKLEEYGFEVSLGVNGLDGLVKMRNDMPDLVVMDYYLSRQSSIEILSKKKADPNTTEIPIIMASTKIDRDKVMQLAGFNVMKFFTKPIKIDSLLKTIAGVLNVELQLDDTPCIIEAHYNDEIIFIEIAQGLNKEKIELLKYKITELLDLYEVKYPKVLIMMSSLEIDSADSIKLGTLLSTIQEYSKAIPKFIKVLTNSEFVTKYILERSEYRDIEVTDSLERAMDGLLGKKAGDFIDDDNQTVSHAFLSATAPKKEKGESLHMKFSHEDLQTENFDIGNIEGSGKITIVDDDMIIRELVKVAFSDTKFEIETFENGRQFIDKVGQNNSDLIFLDLMMPEMNGFQVLEYLQKNKIKLPIIILSALSKQETVIKAMQYGVKSYLIKPLKPELILKKVLEVLKTNF